MKKTLMKACVLVLMVFSVTTLLKPISEMGPISTQPQSKVVIIEVLVPESLVKKEDMQLYVK